MAKQNYTKLPLSQQGLFNLLKQRGLVVGGPYEEVQLRKAISSIGYYRLSGYILSFQRGGSGANRHSLKPGTTVEDILSLYQFDSDLRHHCMSALDDIEVSFRATVCDHLSRQEGSHWHMRPGCFNAGKHGRHFEALAKAAEYDVNTGKPFPNLSNNNEFITHYYNRYSHPPLPPGWMIRECASFKTWALLFPDLLASHQKQICDEWKFPNGKRIDHVVIANWFHSLSVFRNRCAHHARITHKRFPFPPVATTDVSVAPLFVGSNDNLRTLLIVIALLLRKPPTRGFRSTRPFRVPSVGPAKNCSRRNQTGERNGGMGNWRPEGCRVDSEWVGGSGAAGPEPRLSVDARLFVA